MRLAVPALDAPHHPLQMTRSGHGKPNQNVSSSFEVYRDGVQYPLDKSPVWRYMAKDALNGPEVEAVEQFRKAIAESEEARQQKN